MQITYSSLLDIYKIQILIQSKLYAIVVACCWHKKWSRQVSHKIKLVLSLKEWFSLKMAELDLFYYGFQSTDVTRWCDVGLVNSLASVLPGGPCHI